MDVTVRKALCVYFCKCVHKFCESFSTMW